MHHSHFDKAFLLGQKHIECSRMSIEGLWRPTHCNYDSVASSFFVKWICSTLLVRGYEPCILCGNVYSDKDGAVYEIIFLNRENNGISAETWICKTHLVHV